MDRILQDVSLVFSGPMKDSGAELIIAALPTINANTALMLQLFENLVGNALKYRNGRKTVNPN
jgi:light-regulated signal transduction histidine kinase (bacteriophytochrome)